MNWTNDVAQTFGVSAFRIAAITLALLITGCAGGGRHWREEVRLPDERTVTVERRHKLGNPFDQEPQNYKFGPPIVGHVLDIPLPGTKEVARWETDKPLTPLAIGIKDGTVYLATSPGTCSLYEQMGRPVPPYVFYKYEIGVWKRIGIEEFPEEIVNSNLLISTGTDALSAIESMWVRTETKDRLNRMVPPSPNLRTIHRSGTRGREMCIEKLPPNKN